MKEQKRPENAAEAAVSEPVTERQDEQPLLAPERAAEDSAAVSGQGAEAEQLLPSEPEQGAHSSGAAGADAPEECADAKDVPPADPNGTAAGQEGGGETEEQAPKKRKHTWISFVVSIAIIICVVIVLVQLSETLQQGNSATFAELIAGMNWWYMLIAVGIFIVMFATESLKYVLMTRCYGDGLSVPKCMKVALIGKYYENITPTATGGQPMQIYYFYKNGMSGAQGSSITFMKYGVQMLATTIICALLLGFGVGTFNGMVENEAMRNTIFICGWVGFGINAIIPFFVAFVVFCPRAVSWFINLFIKLLHKIKIVKNADKLEAKIRGWLDRFADFSQFIVKHPRVFFLLLLLCFFEPILQYLLPYFVLIAMLGNNVMGMQGWELLFTVAVLACYATNAAAFIPTPGNSGAIETVFMLAFTAVASSVLFWYVLVWRFFLYYTYIIAGIGMNITDMASLIRKKRNERISSQRE